MSFDLELINSDIRIRADGIISTVSDTPKLRQDILKIILTPIGSNKFHPWYGCAVMENISGTSMPENMRRQEIQTSVTQSLERLKTLQTSQSVYQKTSLAELINMIQAVQSNRNPIDPRQVNVLVSVLTKRLSKVEEVFTIIS